MEWGKQNKYHSEIMTILRGSAAETGCYLMFFLPFIIV